MSRAGHATTRPRQRNVAAKFFVIAFVVATPLRHQTLKSVHIFLVPEALLRFRVVVVAKLKNYRVPSSGHESFE